MQLAPIVALIITIVIISAVVGAIAQFLNKLNEANTPPRRPGAPARAGEGGPARQPDRDMDRFLAEIDRLRRKNAEAAQQTDGSQPPAAPPIAKPVAPPAKPAERPRPRVVAELAEPQQGPRQGDRRGTDAQGFTTRLERRESTDAQGFTTPPAAPVSPIISGSSARPEDLPVATVVTPAGSTGAPAATRVTKIAERARPSPKTELARSLTGLLNSGQGVAMAIILQEILGPPRCKKG